MNYLKLERNPVYQDLRLRVIGLVEIIDGITHLLGGKILQDRWRKAGGLGLELMFREADYIVRKKREVRRKE